MIRNLKRLLSTTLMLLLLSVTPLVLAADQAEASTVVRDAIYLNKEKAKLAEPLIIKHQKLYVPLAQLTKMLDGTITWDEELGESVVTTPLDDQISFIPRSKIVVFNGNRYAMDTPALSVNNRTYVPLVTAAQLFHSSIFWDKENKAIHIHTIPLVEVEKDDSLVTISKEQGVPTKKLMLRNELSSGTALKEGQSLRTVVPDLLSNPVASYSEADLLLLAKITQVESGYESYEGQLAVANVILNRVKDSRFPDSIKDVIYSGRQFPPAHNGLLDKSKPNKSVLKAARDALNGINNVEGALYFFNPKYSTGSFWSSLDVVATIGNHRFAK